MLQLKHAFSFPKRANGMKQKSFLPALYGYFHAISKELTKKQFLSIKQLFADPGPFNPRKNQEGHGYVFPFSPCSSFFHTCLGTGMDYRGNRRRDDISPAGASINGPGTLPENTSAGQQQGPVYQYC